MSRATSTDDARGRDLLAALDANAVAAIFVKDLDGVYLHANRACEFVWGLPRAQILGRTDRELLPEECARELRENDRRVVECGRALEFEEYFAGPSGPYVFLTSKIPLRDARGAIVGICGVATDITDRKRYEASLRESEERFRRLADGIPVLLWISSTENEGVYFNRTWLEFTGRSLDDELGQGWLEHLHPEDRPAASAARRAAFAERRAFSIHFRLRREDGAYRWMLDSGTPRFDRGGEFEGYVDTCVDVTERTEAERVARESAERLRFTIDAAGVGTFDLELESGALRWSDNLHSILELPREGPADVAGLLELVDERDRPAVHARIARSLEEGGDFHVDFRTRGPSGERRWLEIKGRVLAEPQGGRARRVTGVLFDVTERRHTVERLREQTLRLVQADRRKDEFLSMLAHELRNPLAPILYTAELLLESEDAQVTRAAATIGRQVRHMSRIVDDLLDVARITRGRIELQMRPCVLREVLACALEIVGPLLEEREHHLSYHAPDSDLRLLGDEARLTQVFANLLHNAAKFTPSGGRIQLEVDAEASALVVRVRDDGRGIEREALEHIFDPLYQVAPSLDRSESGLGLGLTLVKELVERHGGEVAADSAGSGQGSVFTVRLPRHALAADPVDDLPPTSGGEGPRRVLVVDDNRDAAQSLADLLRAGGHVVQLAFDGLEALRRARSFVPDLLLLDIGLPGLDGYEVARCLRAEAGDAAPRIVAVTGYGRDTNGERARDATFDDYLLKPVSREMLERVLAPVTAERGAAGD